MQERKILKYIKGKLSSSEEKEIVDWIISSDQNKRKFNLIKARNIVSTFDECSNEIQVDKAYIKFSDNMKIVSG